MLEKLKNMLGLEDDTSDLILTVMIEDAKDAVMNYCNRHSVPDALENVVRELVVQAFRLQNGDNVASIRRGDTQITYNTAISTDDFTPKMIRQLNRYRIIRMK